MGTADEFAESGEQSAGGSRCEGEMLNQLDHSRWQPAGDTRHANWLRFWRLREYRRRSE